MAQQIELVGKIGSMALIRPEDHDIDYNIFSRIGRELKPGMVWVSSGATEIGRLDYINRTGRELEGNMDEVKTDYAAQGQSILMENYRRFIPETYSVRQVLVEHQHFNDAEKREHIRQLLLRAASQNAIPIINYNDPVSFDENRNMEIASLRGCNDDIVECVDNDETAAFITTLLGAKKLVILSSVDGIYRDPKDKTTLVREIKGKTPEELKKAVVDLQRNCVGASRVGAAGARAKLEYAMRPALQGTTVIIGHARHRLVDLAECRVPCTVIHIESGGM